jgi:hypothetical protein
MYRLDNLCQTGWLICLFFVIPTTHPPTLDLLKHPPGSWQSRAIWTQSSMFCRTFCHRSKRYRPRFSCPPHFVLSSFFLFSNAIDFYNSRFPRFEENGLDALATRMPVSWFTRAKLVALSDAVEPKWRNSVRYSTFLFFSYRFKSRLIDEELFVRLCSDNATRLFFVDDCNLFCGKLASE